MNNWQTFSLTLAKLMAGVILCCKGHCDLGMLLVGAGVYASGKNGFTTPNAMIP